MRSIRPQLVLTAAFGLLASLGCASAQMEDIIRVNLPHATRVGANVLPAGSYTIQDMKEDGSSASFLQIRSENGQSVIAPALRISEPANGPDRNQPERTQVILRRAGNKYELDKIWLSGRDWGYELLPPATAEQK